MTLITSRILLSFMYVCKRRCDGNIAPSVHAFTNEIHNFRNRLYSRLLLSEITDNNFPDERL